MPGFDGDGRIVLHRYDNGVPFTFAFEACSTPEANDGAIPNGTTISSATVTVHKTGNAADVTSQIVAGSPSVAANSITVALKYPAVSGTGYYYIRFVLTITGGAKIEFCFDRLEARTY
jgi:hypothetical protein